ncbi:hypothetical protein [Frigoribacterium salinisoli]
MTAPDVPDVPDVPDAPDVLDAPDAPEVPDVPGARRPDDARSGPPADPTAGSRGPDGRTAPDDVGAATRRLLLDLVSGRRPHGSPVRVAELVREHEVEAGAARLAIARLRDAGLLTCSTWSTDIVVSWHPARSRLLLRRLVRLVEAVVDRAPDVAGLPERPLRPATADALDLTLPDDAARLVALCRSLFTTLPEPVRSDAGPELLDLVEVLCSDEALAVDGSRRSRPASERGAIVDRLEQAARLGDWGAVRDTVREHAVALSPEAPPAAVPAR